MADLCPLPVDCSDTYGELTIDGWSLHTGAWCAHDLSPLFESADHRGENVLVETLPGQQARSLVDDQTDYRLRMMFSGAVDRTGTAHPEGAAGLAANRRAFTNRLIRPIREGTATLPASLVEPDPAGPVTYTADVQPLRLDWTLLPGGYARAVLRLRIPAGAFTVED